MKVRMLKTLLGVKAGKIYPDTYKQGLEYDLCETLIGPFIEQGGIELLETKEIKPIQPENASISTVEEKQKRSPGRPRKGKK